MTNNIDSLLLGKYVTPGCVALYEQLSRAASKGVTIWVPDVGAAATIAKVDGIDPDDAARLVAELVHTRFLAVDADTYRGMVRIGPGGQMVVDTFEASEVSE